MKHERGEVFEGKERKEKKIKERKRKEKIIETYPHERYKNARSLFGACLRRLYGDTRIYSERV